MPTSSTRSNLPKVYIGRLTNVLLRLNVRKTCGDLRRLAETPKLSSLNNGLAKAIIQAAEKSWAIFSQISQGLIQS